jgi:tRNA threonylcarbamoyl adenosine modification protein (Sua5/YciO/YrdC/YwlC family)
VCRDLAEIATYARVEDWAYRLLRAHTPGPFTFILPATRGVPRRLQNARRRTIGIRVPDHPVPRAILEELGEPIMSSTLLLPGDDTPITDPDEIHERLDGLVDAVIESGNCSIEPTSVIDLTAGYPQILRQGRGDTSAFA